MSDVIRFLESMGARADLARMDNATLEAAVAELDAAIEVKKGLASRQPAVLEALMGNGQPMFCLVLSPDSEEKKGEESPDSDEGEEEAPKKAE